MSAPLVAHLIFRLDVGGLENGLVNLINRMPPERYRHAVICLTGFTGFRERLIESVPVYALHKRPGKDPATYLRLWRLLRRLRPSVLHTRNLATLDSQPVGMLAGVPRRVHGEHGYDIHDPDGESRRYQRLRRWVAPSVHRFIALSEDLERYLTERVGVAERKVTRICNGVDTERFHPEGGGRALPWRGAGEDDVVLGAVGRMEEVKDPLNLVRAFLELRRDLPRLRLVYIGDGRLREEALRLLAENGAQGAAWLPGAREDVAALMRGFDVFALPSLAEGISNTVLEAMASGLPVVATRVGGNRELIVEGVTGALAPAGDSAALGAALRPYLLDRGLRRGHGAAARERALAHYGVEAMVERYLEVYDTLRQGIGGGRTEGDSVCAA